MTAVVQIRFKETNYPIMVGDILLSSKYYTRNDFTIPTHDSALTFPPEFKMAPCGLRQKLTVISDHFIVGWAGDAYPARELIEKLLEGNEQEPYTLDSLNSYLDSLGSSVWQNNIALAGFIKEPNRVGWFGRNAEYVTTGIGEVGLLGSGVESIKRYLQNFTILPISSDTNGNNLSHHLLTTLGLTGGLLSAEIKSGAGLDKLFGAGYELATWIDGAFKKVDNITYLFWQAWTDGKRAQIRFPHRSLKISYLKDILVIRVDSLTSLPDGIGVSAEKTTCFFVEPIYRIVDRDELIGFEPPSLNSTFVCNYFAFYDRHGTETVLAASECVGAAGPTDIRFIEDGWRPKQFALRNGYLEDIADRIKKQF